MDEIIKIFVQVVLISIIFSLPALGLKKINLNGLKEFSYFDKVFLNFIFVINLILILSFFNLNIINILIVTFLFILILTTYNFFTNFKYEKKKIDTRIIFFLIFFIIIALDVSFNLELGWDAQKLWFPKTLNFYQGNNLENLEKLHWPEYPYLGSLLWAFFWKISFSEYEYLGRFIYVFIFCLSVFSITDILKVSFIKQILFASINIALVYNYHLFSGYQEILIYSLLIYVAKYSYLLIYEKKLNILYLVLLLFTFNALIWTKNEGIFISLFTLIIIFIFSKIKLNQKLFFSSFLIILIILRLSIFQFYGFELSLQPGSYGNFSFEELLNKLNFERIYLIQKYIFQSFFKNYNYLIMLIPLFFLIYFYRNKNFKNINFILVYLFSHFVFINFAYLMTERPLEFAVKTGVDRLMFEFSAYYYLLIIICVNDYIRSKK